MEKESKPKIKTTKTVIIVVAAVVGVQALLFAAYLIISSLSGTAYNGDTITPEQIALYAEVVTRPDLTDASVEFIPVDELEPYVDGVDYFSEDIEEAFNMLYDALPVSPAIVVRNPDAVIEKKPSSHPQQEAITPVGFYREPEIWVGMGEAIVEHVKESVSDFTGSPLYETFNDPDFWIGMGEGIVEDLLEEFGDGDIDSYFGDGDIDADSLNSRVSEEIAEFVSIVTDEAVEIEEMDEVIDIYVDGQWEELDAAAASTGEIYDGTPSFNRSSLEEYIKAEDYPVNYKAVGRQFYREILSPKQQLAYDVVVTAIQKGLFNVECNFGISEEELRETLKAVNCDYPEFFYLSLAVGFVRCDDSYAEIKFILNKEYKEMGADKALAEIASRMNPVVAAVSKLGSEIDKVKYIVDDMCAKISYVKYDTWEELNELSRNRQDIWSAIVWNDTVCAGYSATFHYYMKLLGINATIIKSGVHGWNLLELDGDYYYMDVTGIDTSGYHMFNFDEAFVAELLKERQIVEGAFERNEMSAKLPAANGNKYSYWNWYASKEPKPATSEPLKGLEGQSVIINGNDVSSKLMILDYDGVLYAEGKTFMESFADRETSGSSHWFNYEYVWRDAEAHVSSAQTMERLFTVCINTNLIKWYTDGSNTYLEMNEKNRDIEKKAFVPILDFAKTAEEMGYEFDLILNGEKYSYKPESGSPAGSETPGGPHESDAPTETETLPNNATPPLSSDEPPTIAINGVDVSDSFDIIELDGVYFAEGESFIESIRNTDMPESMRSYNYDFTKDDEEIYFYLEYWFDPDRGNYLDNSYLHLLELDAIIINSWFTDSIACIFFIDSPYAFTFSEMDELTLWTLDDVPRIVDGECYIPMKEFADVMGFEIAITE